MSACARQPDLIDFVDTPAPSSDQAESWQQCFDQLHETASALQDQCEYFRRLLESLPHALFYCHPASCPLEIQQALHVLGMIYHERVRVWKSPPTMSLNLLANALAGDTLSPDQFDSLRTYLATAETCLVPSAWPEWELLQGVAVILEKYLSAHVRPAPFDYLPPPRPREYINIESVEVANHCLDSPRDLRGSRDPSDVYRSPDFVWFLSNVWTSLDPLRRLHGRIAQLARQRDQALLRFEHLAHRDLSQAAHKSPQALELQIRMLQSLPLRLKGQKSLIAALFRPFKPWTAVVSLQTTDFARDECRNVFQSPGAQKFVFENWPYKDPWYTTATQRRSWLMPPYVP